MSDHSGIEQNEERIKKMLFQLASSRDPKVIETLKVSISQLQTKIRSLKSHEKFEKLLQQEISLRTMLEQVINLKEQINEQIERKKKQKSQKQADLQKQKEKLENIKQSNKNTLKIAQLKKELERLNNMENRVNRQHNLNNFEEMIKLLEKQRENNEKQVKMLEGSIRNVEQAIKRESEKFEEIIKIKSAKEEELKNLYNERKKKQIRIDQQKTNALNNERISLTSSKQDREFIVFKNEKKVLNLFWAKIVLGIWTVGLIIYYFIK